MQARFIDGYFYAVVCPPGEKSRLVDDHPEAGFTRSSAAQVWCLGNASEQNWSIYRFSELFAREAHREGVLDGAEEAASGNSSGDFDRRVAELANARIERVPVPEGDYSGDYARVTIRFGNGDGLVIAPRPDGTLTLAWNYAGPADLNRLGRLP